MKAHSFSDRLGSGVTLLGHSELSNCKAGLEVLEQLAQKASEDDERLILNVVMGFIYVWMREHAPIQRGVELHPAFTHAYMCEHPPIDNDTGIGTHIEAALLFLEKIAPNTKEIDLSHGILHCLMLDCVNLAGANLIEANLRHVALQEANLQEANLERADLTGANIGGADLTGANLKGVKGLAQSEFEKIVYEKNSPPKNVPDALTVPEEGAYTLHYDEEEF